MTLYFRIGDLLTRLEKSSDNDGKSIVLAKVSSTQPSCNGHREDAFILSSTPDLLDLDKDDGPHKLAALLESVPLYQINMELALDRALTERHRNETFLVALEKAFAGKSLPSTLLQTRQENGGETAGNLQHPMLGHIETADLCKIYLSFLKALNQDKTDFSFEMDILGRHPENFLEFYDGYAFNGVGAIRADTLLGFSARVDHDPGRRLESYIEGGSRKAATMMPDEPQERIWAWLEADDYQMRRCNDIHRLLMLPILARRPNWVRTDVFCLLEREAMKQAFADMILGSVRAVKLLEQAPLIKKAIQENADGTVDERLQALLAQVLNTETVYAGAAEKFAQAARERKDESRKMRFI